MAPLTTCSHTLLSVVVYVFALQFDSIHTYIVAVTRSVSSLCVALTSCCASSHTLSSVVVYVVALRGCGSIHVSRSASLCMGCIDQPLRFESYIVVVVIWIALSVLICITLTGY
jgi:hypothetical protein